jgi:carbamoyltransferase
MTKVIWGINALNHDSSIAVVVDGVVKFHGRSSEFSGVKGDDTIHPQLITEARQIAGDPEEIVWYERPVIKKLRQFSAGQYSAALDINTLPSVYLKKVGLDNIPISYLPHHLTHAAAGFYTSSFTEAAIVVIDAIGEFECASIWHGNGDKITKLWSIDYPNSLGLFYSAFTKLIGLTPLSQEYTLQQMSDCGNWDRYYDDVANYFKDTCSTRWNLHMGVCNWQYPILNDIDRCDIAAAVQRVFEDHVIAITECARNMTGSNRLVYVGGCAFNSKCNRLIEPGWGAMWVPSNPGDALSAVGAGLFQSKNPR